MRRMQDSADPDPSSRPRVGPPRCRRYREDGSACENLTLNVDGWCREPDCAGFKRSRRAPESHVELVLETCSGETSVLQFGALYYGTNKQRASRIAGVLDGVGRNNCGRSLGYYRGRDPLHLLASFPPWAHLARVTMYRRHPVSGACELLLTCTYACEHSPASP